MTDKKMTPDELADAVRLLIQENGGCVEHLQFQTLTGTHSYNAIVYWGFDGKGSSVFSALS